MADCEKLAITLRNKEAILILLKKKLGVPSAASVVLNVLEPCTVTFPPDLLL